MRCARPISACDREATGTMEIFDIFLLETLINGLLLGGVLALLALGLNLVFGVIDVIWICYAELVMLGMYTVYTVHIDAEQSLVTVVWRATVAVEGEGQAHSLLVAAGVGILFARPLVASAATRSAATTDM